MRRCLTLLLAVSSLSTFACKFDPKIDANGFTCRTQSDCPAGFVCLAERSVCCNSPDPAACLQPGGSDGAVDASQGETASLDGRGGSLGTGGAAGTRVDTGGETDVPDAPIMATGGIGGLGGLWGGGGTGGIFGTGGTIPSSMATGGRPGTGGVVGAGGTPDGGSDAGRPDVGSRPDVPMDAACPPTCAISCPYGNVLDGNGCPTCACNGPDGGTGGTGTGGTPGTGGAGTGGTPGTGGAGTGGSPGTGGAGTGGSPGTGGNPPGTGGNTNASIGCGATEWPATGNNYAMTVSGTSRTYNLRIPDNYDPNHPYRLILAYHWLNGSAANVSEGSATAQAWYGLWGLSNGTTIFVAPQGTNNGWSNSAGIDVQFTRQLIAQIEGQFCIDKSRILCEGFSMGGSMCYALASAAPDVFRAVAVHSGGSMSGSTPGHNTPVAYFMTHGTKDSVCTYPGYGVPQLQDFAKVNGCTSPDPLLSASLFEQALPEPTSSNGACLNFIGCRAGFPVQTCLFVGDHTPIPGGLTTSWVPEMAWTFLSQF